MLLASAIAALTASVFPTGPVTMRFDPPSPRMGDVVLVYLESGDPTWKKGVVHIFGYEFAIFRVTGEELRAVVAVPIDTPPGEHDIEVKIANKSIRGALPVSDREFDSSELNVSKTYTEKKSKALIAQLKAEQRAIDALWHAEPGPPRFTGTMTRPMAGQFTGVFGTKRVFNGKTNSIHYGLDMDAKIGDPIKAVQGGRIVMSTLRWASGNTVIIDHGGGLFTAYFHMSKLNRKSGELVQAGDILGLAGKTGRVTGPHLHLAVMVRTKYAGGRRGGQTRSLYADPAPFLGLVF